MVAPLTMRSRRSLWLMLPWLWLACSESEGGNGSTAQASSGAGGGANSMSSFGASTSASASSSQGVSTTTGSATPATAIASSGQVSGSSSGTTSDTATSTTGQGGSGTVATSVATGGSGGDNTLSGSRGAGGNQSSGGTSGGVTPSLLVFSRTLGFRHDSIPVAIEALGDMAEAEGWMFAASEDPTVFSDEGLSPYNVLVMLSPTGDILDAAQQSAFERYIQAGNGFVGIHAASDTEFDWAWYGGLVGAFFRVHPDIQPATLIVENRNHPSTAHLPETWARTDEWYSFETNPREDVTVLISIDETSYSPGESEMDGDHPIAWYHEYDGGRSFYTALGHTSESYSEPEFMAHVKGGIEWAARVSD